MELNFDLRDLLFILSIAVTLGTLLNEFRHVKMNLEELKELVTNGLTHRIDRMETIVEDLPCRQCPTKGECDHAR